MSAPPFAPATLLALWGWGALDNLIAARSGAGYKPVDLPENPSYTAEKDVTLIVPTIDTPDTFPESLRTWLDNKPHEIIIVTTISHLTRVNTLLQGFDTEIASGKISVVVSPKPGKRQQLNAGIPHAKGRILTLSDDDTYWGPEFLKYMLACFEDPKVGGAGGAQSARVLHERKDEKIITMWETASVRILDRRNGGQVSSYAADGGVFILAGRSVLFRTEILQDGDFLYEFTHDYWLGKYLLDSGDDTFITRWLQEKNWDIVIQSRPETEIQTGIATDSKFLGQLVRWERNTIQSFVRSVFTNPLVWKYPRVARKMVERLLRPVFTLIQIYCWIMTIYEFPFLGVVILDLYLDPMIRTYAGFLRKYPYCRRQLFAAVLVDYCFPVLDLYAWATINNMGWLTRDLGEVMED